MRSASREKGSLSTLFVLRPFLFLSEKAQANLRFFIFIFFFALCVWQSAAVALQSQFCVLFIAQTLARLIVLFGIFPSSAAAGAFELQVPMERD